MPPHATFCTTTQLEMPPQVNALTLREILMDVKRLKPVGTQITGVCSLCSQNIVAALMVAGVMRVVCVTVLNSRHLETAVRSVSNTHSIEHNTAEKYEQRHIYQFHDTKLCQNIFARQHSINWQKSKLTIFFLFFFILFYFFNFCESTVATIKPMVAIFLLPKNNNNKNDYCNP